MDILVAIILFGALQTVCTVANHRSASVGPLTGLLGAAWCYAVHPWAADLNFVRLNAALAQPAVLSALGALLLVEAAAKVLERFHDPDAPVAGRHAWFALRQRAVEAACRLVRYLPPLSLLFAVFYAQAYAFHSVERLSFRALSLLLSAVFGVALTVGSLALRRAAGRETRALLAYRLLFFQLLVALLLPVIGRLGRSVPLYHGPGIYLGLAALLGTALPLAGIGYLTTRRLRAGRLSTR